MKQKHQDEEEVRKIERARLRRVHMKKIDEELARVQEEANEI